MFHHRLLPHGLLLIASGWAVLRASDVAILVDGADQRQVIEGFGATTISWADSGVDQLGALRGPVLDAVYGQVRLGQGDIHCHPYEGGLINPAMPGSWNNLSKSNDNADANAFDWTRFTWWRSDGAKTLLYDPARPKGFTDVLLAGHVSTRWGDPWLGSLRTSDRPKYLTEAAENAVAILVHWRDAYGYVPRWHQPFNEPLSGNTELLGANTQDVVDLVKAIGARFQAEGFGTVKLVVASEETTTKSLSTAQAILADPVARSYVGAIGYHSYPYGSTYCKAANILATSGSGAPSQTDIDRRTALRSLAAQYGLQTWMTEVSHSEADAWTTFRARAIHIRDEFLYARANAFWAMFNIYDTSQTDLEDMVVVFDPPSRTWRITGMGRAIGHYARWLTPRSSHQLGSTSSDALVQTSVFRDTALNRLVAVLINNRTSAQPVALSTTGIALTGQVVGEQSTQAGGYWQPVSAFSGNASGFSITLPALSVTTCAIAIAGGNQPPQALAQTVAVTEDVPKAITLLGTDADGSITAYTIATPPAKGTLSGSGSSRTYTPAADANGSDGFSFTVTDNAGAVSAPASVSIAIAAVNDPPVNTTAPRISGTASVGQALTGTTGTWNDTADGGSIAGYAWQWQRAANPSGTGLADIAGANASTYVLTATDLGAVVRVRVTATDAGAPAPAASASALSGWSAAVAMTPDVTPPPTPAAPTVAASGAGLVASGATEPGASVQVYVDGVLAGSTVANGGGAWTLSLAAPAPGMRSVTVTATDAAGNTSAASPATSVTVTGGGTAPAGGSGGGGCGAGAIGAMLGILLALIAIRRWN